MKPEQAVGEKVAWLRQDRQMTQAQLGTALEEYLGKPWSRQTVHAAEKGQRAFTATELVALALALETTVPSLFLPYGGNEPVTLPSGHTIDRSAFRDLAFHPADIRGKSAANSWDALRVALNALRSLDETHKVMGTAIAHGYETLSIAVQSAEAQENAEQEAREQQEEAQ